MNAYRAVLLASAVLAGCNEQESAQPKINKTDRIYLDDHTEGTPIVFNGRVVTIVSERPFGGSETATSIVIDDLETKVRIAKVSMPNFGLTSAIVVEGIIYVFGSTDWTRSGNSVRMIQSRDLINWTPPVTVLQASNDQTIFNTSVTSDSSGFAMAYEVKEPGLTSFTPRFAQSSDLLAWLPIGGPFDSSRYSACPVIRFVGGYYYMLYLGAIGGKYLEYAARSTDLRHWQTSPDPILKPDAGEGTNTSDLDLVEFNGKVIFTYAIGDQSTWTKMKIGIYPGTLRQYFEAIRF